MNSICLEPDKIDNKEKKEKKEKKAVTNKKERRRPPPIKIDDVFRWNEAKTIHDPPSPPHKKKKNNYFSFLSE